MPSSKKTPNLLLNRWLGSDKPKKDDFNEDNDILDQNIGRLRGDVAALETQSGQLVAGALEQMEEKLAETEDRWLINLGSAGANWESKLTGARQELEGKLSSASTALGGRIDTVSANLGSHTGSADVHVTAAQKTAWDGKGVEIGSYSGNGNINRTISLSFTPRAGVVFAQNYPLQQSNWATQYAEIYAATFTSGGGSAGIAPASGGFSVTNSSGSTDGYAYRLNQSGVTYLYMAWR